MTLLSFDVTQTSSFLTVGQCHNIQQTYPGSGTRLRIGATH